jgi:hypothetical protein
LINLRNVLSLIFDSVIVSYFFLLGNHFSSNNLVVFDNSSFSGNLFNSLNLFVFDLGSFIRNVFDSGLSLNNLRSSSS